MNVSAQIGCSARVNNSAAFLVIAWLLATMSLWFFAFYDLPAQTPEWIRRAQVACFGSDASGLPGAAGWMVLALSPAAFLAAIVLCFSDEIKTSLQTYLARSSARVFIVLIMLVVSVEVYWVASSIRSRLNSSLVISDLSSELPQGYPRGSAAAPNFELIDQKGNSISLSSLRGKPIILSFVFAHCQSVCPVLLKTVNQVVERSKPGTVQALFITLDPWRDSPAALPGLAAEWKVSNGVSLLSGEPDKVNQTLDAYNVPRDRDSKTGDVVHPALVYLIGPDGELAFSFNNPSVEWIIAAIARLDRSI